MRFLIILITPLLLGCQASRPVAVTSGPAPPVAAPSSGADPSLPAPDIAQQVLQLDCGPLSAHPRPFIAEADGPVRAFSHVHLDPDGRLTIVASCEALRDSLVLLQQKVATLRTSKTRPGWLHWLHRLFHPTP